MGAYRAQQDDQRLRITMSKTWLLSEAAVGLVKGGVVISVFAFIVAIVGQSFALHDLIVVVVMLVLFLGVWALRLLFRPALIFDRSQNRLLRAGRTLGVLTDIEH